ncbi:MAG: RNA polymerase sigma factor [Gemmataceae bacterium]
MTKENTFRDLLQRVRAGDDAAAAELVRRYEPAIRRAVRVRLTDPRLNRLFDSMDVCQSVMANFFMRAAAGQFDLESPEQLLKLLVTMARNKLLDYARKQQSAKRGQGKVVPDSEGKILAAVAAADQTPSRIVAGKELLREIRQRLSAEELFLMDQRALGREWADIAAELGGQANALRMKLSRALDRVSRQMGLKEAAEAE